MVQPAQHQNHQPGREKKMMPPPESFMEHYKPAGRLAGKAVLISGGDSGIGRAIGIGCAKEGADVAFIYLEEEEDAEETVRHIEAEGRKCYAVRGDIKNHAFCKYAVAQTVAKLGKLDILVNNAGEAHDARELTDITPEQLLKTFNTNIFGMFYLTQAAMPHLKEGDAIINTASSSAYQGEEALIDYSASKGAVVAFTRALAANLVKRKIRVNAVAPGPIWTPLIPSSLDENEVEHFGEDVPMGRAGQPDEVAPCFIFLASDDARYMTGQVLHPNGGMVVNG